MIAYVNKNNNENEGRNLIKMLKISVLCKVAFILIAITPNANLAIANQAIDSLMLHLSYDENLEQIKVTITNKGESEFILINYFIPEDYFIRFVIKDKERNIVPFSGPEIKIKIDKTDLVKLKKNNYIGKIIDLDFLKKYYEIKEDQYKIYAIYEIPDYYANLFKNIHIWDGKLMSNEIIIK